MRTGDHPFILMGMIGASTIEAGSSARRGARLATRIHEKCRLGDSPFYAATIGQNPETAGTGTSGFHSGHRRCCSSRRRYVTRDGWSFGSATCRDSPRAAARNAGTTCAQRPTAVPNAGPSQITRDHSTAPPSLDGDMAAPRTSARLCEGFAVPHSTAIILTCFEDSSTLSQSR